tara:strand:+ start:297 stop:1007 length:711 start_codon:yes stop_codon:yes gene_type:complete
MSKTRVLIVEDDRSLADVLAYNLEQNGFEVTVSHDGQDGLTRARLDLPDIVILDVMLPVLDGHEVCRCLRAEAATQHTRILMLTAKSEESDQLIGFALGADDYVTKPFSVKVLLQRIKVLERSHSNRVVDEDVVSHQNLTIDRARHTASVNKVPLELTRTEFRLLDTLVRQPGRVFQRSELIDASLGKNAVVLERTIDVHIRALRKKLHDSANLIETVRGVGYRFRDSHSEQLPDG